MRLKTAAFVLAALAGAACASTSTSAGSSREVNGVRITEEKEGLWARATLAPDAAIKIALARVPGGTIDEAELEEENGRLVYSFDIKVAGATGEHEIDVDAVTGAVLKAEHQP